ncbi:MAG: hypothetical protein Kow00102_07000 [Spirochaetota bacterium]
MTGVTIAIAIICPYCGHCDNNSDVERDDNKIFTNKLPVNNVIKIF